MERTNENIVSSYFFYMWNYWGTEKECKEVFGRDWKYFWEKWCGIFRENKRGAAEIFYAELSWGNRRKLVERACQIYDGDSRR